MSEYPIITDQEAFDSLVEQLVGAERYAIDTEFHRERTYYPRLALVQIAWDDGLVLVDPLIVDISTFRSVLESDALAVMHAAGQDLEVLERSCGTVPKQIFDTQIAAGFVGMRSPSLAALHDQLLGTRLPKGDRLTDWLQRPLESAQLRYAAGDVEHLLEIHDQLNSRLSETGRSAWADDEFENLRQRTVVARDPEDAWRRLKEARSFRGKQLKAVRGVAAWRESRAQLLDQPPRYLLSDLAVVSVAQRQPQGVDDFGRIRGLDDRQLKQEDRLGIIEAIRLSMEQPLPVPTSPRNKGNDVSLRPAVTLVAAWLAQFSNDFELDPALLGSRSDIEAFLRGDDEARLSQGWRAKLVGELIHRLVGGEASLAFDPTGGLVLEHRSNEAIAVPDRP